MICFADNDEVSYTQLNGKPVSRINADLTSGLADLTKAVQLRRNAKSAFMGDKKNGPFDIPGDLARSWLQLPANPNGRPNADVLKPWVNGMDLTRRPSGKWIIDFGFEEDESEAALYEIPFAHIAEHVRPMRLSGRHRRRAEFWYRHATPGPETWQRLDGLSRFIVTPRVAKYRLFVWCDVRVCPDCQLFVIPRDDDTAFGILHSRFHEVVVAPTLHLAWQRQRSPLHAHHHVPDIPIPSRAVPRHPRRRLCEGTTRPDHRRRAPAGGWNYATAGSTRPNGSSG